MDRKIENVQRMWVGRLVSGDDGEEQHCSSGFGHYMFRADEDHDGTRSHILGLRRAGWQAHMMCEEYTCTTLEPHLQSYHVIETKAGYALSENGSTILY